MPDITKRIEDSSSVNNEDKENDWYTVKGFADRNRKRGTWPSSEASIWALKQNSDTNGFKDCFINIDRRVLINSKKFWEILIKKSKEHVENS